MPNKNGYNFKMYGVAEIAKSLGVARQTAAQWHWRKQMPPPYQKLSSGPVWLDVEIEHWIEKKKGGAVYRGMISEDMLDTIAKDRPQLQELVDQARKADRSRRPQIERRIANRYLTATSQSMTLSGGDVNELSHITTEANRF